MLIGLLLVEALPSSVSGQHFVFFLVLFLCCFVSVLTIHSFVIANILLLLLQLLLVLATHY